VTTVHEAVAIAPTPSDGEAVDFLRELVATPSVSGREVAAAELFSRTAARWGLEASIDEVGNAIATRGGPELEKEIVLLGHIDTVPGEIPVRIENGVLHGRGSVDAKGPLAAMLAAAARTRLPGVRVRVVGAVGEETPHSPGARFIAPRLRPDACIIGEPSHVDGATLGYKGRLVMTATVRSECGHSAAPHGSPADAVIAFWTACQERCAALNNGRAGAYEVVQSTIQSVASSSNGLFAEATLVCGFRLPRWIGPTELESQLTEIAGRWAGISVRFLGHEAAYASDRNDLVARALSGAIRAEGMRPHPKLKTGTSDMNVVAPLWRCPIAAYGPGDSALDHTAHEHLSLDEYARSIRVLSAALVAIAAELA
jgi:[amino group carrier protein]-lysine/ornithine hydrolase